MALLVTIVGVLIAVLPVQAHAQAATEASPRMELVPRTSFTGPELEFDFPGLEIGVAEYEQGPTGTTVFYFPNRAVGVVDVRGGSPGTIGTDRLRLAYTQPRVDAISFAGGSLYGLAVATGVADEIKAQRTDAGQWGGIAGVAGAIIFDLGERRLNTVTPDEELGRAALRAARPGRFPLGARGAGRFALQGWYFGNVQYSGQGGAFRQVGPIKVAVFTVVNSMGSIVDRTGHVVRCHEPGPSGCGTIREYLSGRVEGLAPIPIDTSGAAESAEGLTRNTTLTLVVTNQKLAPWALQRLAVQVHTSMARAIQPFSTQSDGDVLFAVTTSEVEDPDLSPVDLGVIASELAWDAVLSSMPVLPPPPDPAPVRPSPDVLRAYTGRYAFSSGDTALVHLEDGRLWIEALEPIGLYVRGGELVELIPVSPTEFLLKASYNNRIRFDQDENERVVGLTLNPGWPIPARRVRH